MVLSMPKDKYDNSNTRNGRRSHKIMSAEDVASGKKSHWPELEITGTIRNLSPQLWRMNHLTSLYLNDNHLTRLPPDVAKLTMLRCLDLSCNKLRSLPAELGDLINLRELLLNNNMLRVLPYELGRLFQLQIMGLNGNPLSHEILSIYGEQNGTAKLLAYMLDNLAGTFTHNLPPQRPWITLEQPNRSRPHAIFSVMCYNVLCDKYATRQIYGYCPSWALGWEYRKKGILHEILNFTADIISLQEVETEQYHTFFLPELRQHGYDGIFSPKSRAKTMGDTEKKYVDGCAIFFKTNKFQLVKEHLVEFNKMAMENAEGSADMLNRVMTKDNIGIAALLETKDGFAETSAYPPEVNPRQLVLVANAHMHWDPEFSDVKIIQTMMFMSALKNIMEEACHSFRPGSSNKMDISNVPVIFCGDLNSLPDSGVVEYLATGRISTSHLDFKELAYSECLGNFSCADHKPSEVTHSFKLKQAYESDILPHTNYTFDFKGVIDYIFHSELLTCLGVLGPYDPHYFSENKIIGCPHPHIPSDHIPLLSEFELQLPYGPLNGLPNGLHIARR
ncbi:CCR4-NOT transcription complex subunit 6-like isoform X1 [Branchiostoma floridae]|uniref:poly(A)-specific ribonuclease n=1 Tax=Branchiostoma floridae TaxID=7739 RepID=A0A9J7KRS4_BRAFL|nr:CCR4-NOT transcription complex subunit 6-like isoform X1 [Branchiostoma floridae]